MRTAILDAATLVPQTVLNSHPQTAEHLLPTNYWDINASRLVDCTESLICFAKTSPAKVLEHCHDADVVITNKVILSEEILNQLTNLKLVVIAATGTNNVDLDAARKRGIKVCNVQNYSTPGVVQNCFALTLSLFSQMAMLQEAMTQQGWQNQSQFVMLPDAYHELNGKTFGIIGYGTIGKAVAKVAHAFGMRTIVAQLAHRAQNKESTIDRVPLAEFLAQCDVVSLHCPLSEETQQLVDQRFLSQMKSSAILINTARGGLIQESHLAEALCSGHIGGAGLDVLSTEPPSSDNPLLQSGIPNLIVTPHIAWASQESRQRLIDEIAENIIAFNKGYERNRVC